MLFHKKSTGLVAYFMKAYPGRTFIMILCLIVAGLTEGIGVTAMLPLLDVGTSGKPSTELGRRVADMAASMGLPSSFETFLMILVAGIVLKGACSWLAMRQVGYTVSHVAADLRMKLIRALLGARWGYFVSHPAGRFANAISVEAWQAAEAYYEASISIAFMIQLVVYTVAAMMVSWQVAVGAFVVGIVIMFFLKGLIKVGRRAGKSQTDMIKALVSRLTDALQGIKPIKAMACESHLLPLLASETRDLYLAQRRQVLARESLRIVQEPVTVAFLALGLLGLVKVGNQPFSTILVLAFIFYRMVTRFNEVQYRYQKMVTVESAFWSLMDSIRRAETETEIRPATGTRPSLEKEIRFEDVRFSYGDTPVLKGVSLTIPAGGFVGIAGHSGAGKTTIADLIIGLGQPQGGMVRIDETPLPQVDLTAWRKMVGYVPQEMFLFHETIYSNIVLGDASIGRDDVEAALRSAGAWDFVSQLPEGMDTLIGERGGRISGGERQRIAIAAALVRKPKLLVLDEVTTALDPDTEAGICATLRDLAGTVTIVAISHQPALMKEAGILYRVENGRVIQIR
jgi:ATP-binding cassette subfamily C protein